MEEKESLKSLDKTCKLADHGYDLRTESPCCWINKRSVSSRDILASQYMQSEWAIDLRHALANGIEHPACNHCWDEERRGKNSKRIHTANDSIDWNGQPGDLNFLTLFVSNKCNLACRTCGAGSSTAWIKEASYNFKRSIQDEIKEIKKPRLGVKKFRKDQIDVPLDKLRYIEVLGGEPFYETDHIEFLERVCKEADASKITIFYSTNGTIVISKEIEKILSKFKEVRINLSIDAVYKPFSYIRTLGDFEDVERAIDYWKSIPNVTLKNHATLSVLNIMEFKSLYEYFTVKHNWNDIQLNYTYVSNVPHYDFSVIPESNKAKYFDDIMENLKYSKQNMQSIQNYFLGSTHNEKNLVDFKRHIKYTHEFRKLDIAEYLPNLCRILEL